MKNDLKITISGEAGSGKSRILYLIKTLLRNKGFKVEHNVNSDHPDEISFDRHMDETLENAINSISRKIVMEEKQINRTTL